MFYGSNVWDPVLIISQIISVQCLFYFSLGLIQAVTIGPSLGYITIAYIFDWSTLHFWTKLGWLNWLSHLLNSLAAAATLAWIVERAKKCLDFATTCYIWHAIFVCCYSGWPRSAPWWIANVIGFLTMLLLGEWLCVAREMQDIPINLHKWGSGRKQSGVVMTALPTEDPDLVPRPRLRAAAAAGSSSSNRLSAASPSSSTSAAAGMGPAPRPGAAHVIQMAALNGSSGSSSSTRDSFGGAGQRKKLTPTGSFSALGNAGVAAPAGASSWAAAVDNGDHAV